MESTFANTRDQSVPTAVATRKNRLVWIDQAKAYGMFLVYYGHFTEQLARFGNPSATLQYKLIYSFHMPLFFVLSGYVYKDKQESFSAISKRLALTRLVPVLFFNGLALLMTVADELASGTFQIDLLINGVGLMLMGHPPFNWITWFLVCLFTVELINYGVQKYIHTTAHTAIAIVLFISVGGLLHGVLGGVFPGTGITNNVWFVDEALFAYPLFLIGVLLKQLKYLQSSYSRRKIVGIVVSSAAFVFFTFNLNPNGVLNPFRLDPDAQNFAVRMAHSDHGNLFWFVMTAIAGTLCILYLAQLIPARNPIVFIGKNTLILLGLNHFFFVAFGRVAPLVNPYLQSHGAIVVFCTGLTAVSLLLCSPCIKLMNRYVPQWVGRRKLVVH